MPELPEVETMVRGLRPAMTGRVVEEALILDPFLLQGCAADEFKARVSGATVEAIDRRGKWVVFNLRDNRGIIVIQPRMTGGFWLVSPERLDHARLTFRMRGSGQTIWFCDNRRLGKIAWFPDQKSAEQSFQKSHGPDALEVTQDELAEKLGKTSRAIKPTLKQASDDIATAINNAYQIEGTNTILELVRQGYGHTIMPKEMILDHELATKLTITPLSKPKLSSTLSIAVPDKRRLTNLCEQTIKIIKDTIGKD